MIQNSTRVMEKYLSQLLADIADATANVSSPFIEKELALQDWMPPEEEEKYAPGRQLEDWTGINKLHLPPAENSLPHR